MGQRDKNFSLKTSIPTEVARGAQESADASAEAKLYRLMLVDEDTGQPQRLASLSEAEIVAQTLSRDASSSSLPCLKSASREVTTSEGDSEPDSPRSSGQLSKSGGPCHHCGASAVRSFKILRGTKSCDDTAISLSKLLGRFVTSMYAFSLSCCAKAQGGGFFRKSVTNSI